MTEIIAEIGVNHDGSLEKARTLVETAARCGANVAKFQTFRADTLVAQDAPTATYQQAHHAGDQRSMLERLELTEEDFRNLHSYCQEWGIEFLSSPFDRKSAEFLLGLGLTTIKVGSGELTNSPFLRWLGGRAERVILSTGMADIAEVAAAVGTLKEAGLRELVLLHCVTEYPAPVDQINLRAMETMRRAFGVTVGYSDHTEGNEVAIAAVALGAEVIEKHLTLDPAAPGPDHAASSDPEQFANLVSSIRNIEKALGDGRKVPAACELPNRLVARKSLVAARDLPRGTVLGPDDVQIKRPGNGIPPDDLDLVIGFRLIRPVKSDEVLSWGHLKDATS